MCVMDVCYFVYNYTQFVNLYLVCCNNKRKDIIEFLNNTISFTYVGGVFL